MARRERHETWLDKAEAVRHGAKTFTKYALPVASTVASLAALINIEKKFYDTANYGVTFGSGLYTNTLTSVIPQGDGESQCIGNSIKLLSCYLKYRITNNSTENSAQSLRVIVVADRDANGAAPAVTDILQAGVATSGAWMISPLNKSTSFHSGQTPRFQMLLDRVHNNQNVTGLDDGTGFHEHYWDQRNKFGENHHCLWSGDTHSDSTVLGGHLYLLVLYSQTTVSSTAPSYAYDTTNPPGFAYYARVRYTDD